MDFANGTGLAGHRCVIIDALKVPFRIGIHDHEKEGPQEVVITVRMFIPEDGPAESTDIADYVSYSDVVRAVEALARSDRHILLVENLAEEIAGFALADGRVSRVVVDVRKTEIIPAAAGVGVIIERTRPA
jgi:dihydroneopterin aldolase